MTKRRVVITGLGAVSPLGIGVDELWNSLIEGKSGIATTTMVDLEKHPVKISGEVKNFVPEDYIDLKNQRKWIDLPSLRWLQLQKR
jgi:3-oxoacyl-[acyl-carrier-protein] synthase II